MRARHPAVVIVCFVFIALILAIVFLPPRVEVETLEFISVEDLRQYLCEETLK